MRLEDSNEKKRDKTMIYKQIINKDWVINLSIYKQWQKQSTVA